MVNGRVFHPQGDITLNIILGVLGLAVAVMVGLAMTKPNEFRMQRDTAINPPPEKIFAILNDFKRWGEFSPWDKKDPAMKRKFGDITAGKGGYYGWEGNKDVGIGSTTIAESTPSTKLVIRLDFVKPFEANKIVEFNLSRRVAPRVWSGRCADRTTL